ncbi:MFS transporter, partial [Dehalococcoidia bacterium]|nr:MFS transporter [Dehalococcoidia bacterium]
GALLGLAVLAMSMIENPVQLYGGFAALRTLGQGSFTLIPTTLVALWWIRLRGRAIAIITLGITGAQAGLPPLTHWLIESYGWREAWAVLGIGVWIIVLLPSAVLVRRSPESVGLKPDGQALAQTEGTSQTPTISEPSWSLRQIIPTRTFWLLFFASSSPPLLTTGLMFHNTSLLETRGLDAGTAAFVISTMAPMAVLATFVTGYCADRFTNRYLMAASHAMLGLAAVVPLLISESWHAFIYGAAMGMAMGSAMTMINVIWANYYGRANLGSIRGASTMGVVAFAALGPLPFGILYEATGSYTLPILIFLSLPVASGICSILAGPPSLKTTPASTNR